MFNNLTIIRRHYIEKWDKAKKEKTENPKIDK